MPSTSSGRPALGTMKTGLRQCSAEVAHVLDHLLGAGGAVDAEDVDDRAARASMAAQAISVPRSIVPVVSMVTLT